MNSSSVIRICRLQNLYSSCADSSEHNDTSGSGLGLHASKIPENPHITYALLGTLRIADKKTVLDHPPYEVYPGSLLFVEKSEANDAHSVFIRCYALEPQTSWFCEGVCLLLTSWRFIGQPRLLKTAHIETLTFIEILDPPLVISQQLSLPTTDMQLTWWLEKRIQPELELWSQLQAAAACTSVTSGRRAARLLLSGAQSGGDRPLPCAPISILGTASAVCKADIQLADTGGFKFIVDLVVEAMYPADAGDTWGAVKIPVMFSGLRFTGIYASLLIGDSLFVTYVQPANIVQEHVDRAAVFCTTAQSQAFRIDEFDGMDGSQLFARQTSLPPTFTHGSQQSLLSQIEVGQESVYTALPFSQKNKRELVPEARPIDKNLLVHQEKLESYEGVVSRMLDMALGIYVIDESHILVLRYWPQFHPLLVLRPGTRVLLESIHVVLLANSEDYHWGWLAHAFPDLEGGAEMVDKQQALVFGACARSSVRITGFAADFDPGTARLIANCDLTRAMTRSVEGTVHMIETLEAFWRFSRKFPNGPVSKRRAAESEGQLMSLAMLWTSASRSHQRKRHLEFLRHDHHCQSARSKAAARVVTLETVLRRLKRVLDERRKSGFSNDNVGAASTEVIADGVSPADLQLQAVPLIGRLVLGERGELFLWDSTGHLLVHPSFVSTGRLSSDFSSAREPLIAGQMLVGHLYAWNNWRFVTETIDVMSISKTSYEAGNFKPGPSPDFRLVYAAISNPVILCVDATFGGLVAGSQSVELHSQSGSEFSGDSGTQQQPLCFVLFVHWQSAAAPAANKEMADGAGWRGRVTVRGVSFKIDYSGFESQMQNAMDDRPLISIDFSENDASKTHQLESCFLQFSSVKVPAMFAPNCAYVVCVHKKQRSGYVPSQGAAQDMFFVKLGSMDRVYPVHLSVNGESLDTGLPQISRQLPVATVNVLDKRFGANPADWFLAPRSFSIKELHDSLVSDAAAGAEIAGRLVSVFGVVVRRKVSSVVEFACSGSDGGQDMRGGLLVAGMFDNAVILGDESDMSLTTTLYIKLYSFAHPLGLLPGACVEFQNLSVGISKTSNQIYLTSTSLTTVQHVAAKHAGSAVIDAEQLPHADPESKPSRVCIGELYYQAAKEQLGREFIFSCRVAAIEHLSVSVECKVCGQVVSNMGCLCIRKHYRMVDRNSPDTGYASDATTVSARVELLCRVVDGSGMARVAANSVKSVVHALGLSPSSLEELYESAARSWNGCLIWKQQSFVTNAINQQLGQQQAGNAQESDSASNSGVVERVVSRARAENILVQGFVARLQKENGQPSRSEQQQEQQTLRMDGRSVVLVRNPLPRVIATQVRRLGVIESCWDLLEKSGS